MRFCVVSLLPCKTIFSHAHYILFTPVMGWIIQANKKSVLVIYILSCLLTACQNSKPAKAGPVETYSLNAISRDYDSQWEGILKASDGNVYFASSTHSYRHGAGVFKFNPATKKLTVLAEDITRVVGEDPGKTPPQGKIHSPFVEASGWIYFTTHISTYWKNAIDTYTGAHVVGYEMATGKFKDFGIIKSRYTIYSAINVDPDRGLLYVFLTPFADEDKKNDRAHLYSIDIKSGEKTDLGRLAVDWGKHLLGSLYFFMHKNGDLWFSVWSDDGQLYKYSPTSKKIERFANVLPSARLAPDGKPAPQTEWATSWTWAQALPGNEKCVFSMGYYGGGDERLWLFDPSKKLEEGEAFQPLAYTGTNFLSMALGGNRVYFVQKANIAAARGYDTESERDKDPDKFGYNEDLHLRSVSLNSEENKVVLDHGLIIDKKGRKLRMSESLAADDNGNIYLVGSWYLLKGEKGTLMHRYGKIEPGPMEEVKRGEFFGVMKIK